TQDNQILSLMPFALIFYALAGVSGASIIIQGWLIFVVNAALTGLLVKVGTKSWIWAGLAWLLALLAGPMAIGQPAIFAYPVTHNSVWAFGLLGTIGLIRYFTDRPKWALPLVLACVFVGTVSDPWFDAAFTAPLLLLAWRSPAWFHADKTTRRALIKTVIITYIAGRITYFGLELLHMVPGRGIGFASPSAMLHHLVLLAKSTGILLQFYPFPSGDLAWVLFLWGIYLISLCGVVILSFQARRQVSPAIKVLLAFSGLSIGIIACLGLLELEGADTTELYLYYGSTRETAGDWLSELNVVGSDGLTRFSIPISWHGTYTYFKGDEAKIVGATSIWDTAYYESGWGAQPFYTSHVYDVRSGRLEKSFPYGFQVTKSAIVGNDTLLFTSNSNFERYRGGYASASAVEAFRSYVFNMDYEIKTVLELPTSALEMGLDASNYATLFEPLCNEHEVYYGSTIQ
ncbi:MAG: hypothetical protein PHI57_09725, partial [Bacteroidales bacterium]|nr:hypothetical protein [Bacteroidales bacterium]